MATSQASDTDDADFTDEEIEESLKPFLDELDSDYEQAYAPIFEEFKKKGPPQKSKSSHPWLCKSAPTGDDN